MIINKYNKSIIDIGFLNLHDAFIESIDYNVKLKVLTIRVHKYKDSNLVLEFKNVFDFSFSSYKGINGMFNNEIFSWEEIPNDVIKDNYIEEIKKQFELNGGEWNNNLFAIRFLLTNMCEFKIICENIIAE